MAYSLKSSNSRIRLFVIHCLSKNNEHFIVIALSEVEKGEPERGSQLKIAKLLSSIEILNTKKFRLCGDYKGRRGSKILTYWLLPDIGPEISTYWLLPDIGPKISTYCLLSDVGPEISGYYQTYGQRYHPIAVQRTRDIKLTY